ncbi:hypothetical protein M514_12072 [Trichuris suis]|uniref:Uncharacterized protein n=1 Tax=Trichuris suis TaxID=68888 RepID=A0A085MVW5_9BILA|nr:hypothetical protein M513_12072 [Trichuris suis]KFD61361.1 hypothetical protein M514_12072 [Trichuris suis]
MRFFDRRINGRQKRPRDFKNAKIIGCCCLTERYNGGGETSVFALLITALRSEDSIVRSMHQGQHLEKLETSKTGRFTFLA